MTTAAQGDLECGAPGAGTAVVDEQFFFRQTQLAAAIARQHLLAAAGKVQARMAGPVVAAPAEPARE